MEVKNKVQTGVEQLRTCVRGRRSRQRYWCTITQVPPRPPTSFVFTPLIKIDAPLLFQNRRHLRAPNTVSCQICDDALGVVVFCHSAFGVVGCIREAGAGERQRPLRL
jgi:hypothetical protein